MDMGCGTGMLIHLAGKRGIAAEGIELTPSRATLARQLSQATIYETPVEDLKFPDQSFAAVIAINVFSHLRKPSETLAEIRRILAPGGVLMLVTGEIGAGLRKGHNFRWTLGEELYYLGDHTIEWYGRKIGFELLQRDRTWLPHVLYGKQRFREKGSSSLRNIAKKAFLYTPGALPALRYYVSYVQRDNPIHSSTLLLKRIEMESRGQVIGTQSAD
jgi:SAM-dependent methyltransferase